MAKITSKIPNLNNLKQCLRFLEWLKTREDLQYKVANELERRLKIYYSKDADAQNIKTALSSFLGQVSHFYDKLCKNAQPTNYMANTPSVVLFTLLACIPKVLSVVYFLQYNVDAKFKTAGGGGWEDQLVAAPTSGVSKIDAYFTDGVFKRNAVIPGGFKSGELKPADKGGYVNGSVMAHDLPKVLGELHQNFFSDVFVTSALTTAGSQPSNTANALALLKTFCEIVVDDHEQKIEKALKGNISGDGNCIPWERLREQCSKLKESLEQIFNAGVLSNTGHSPKNGDLIKEKFARKMAKWLRDNLDKVRGSLKNIKTDHHIEAVEYFTEHFFPYGFIFDEHGLRADSNGSESLKQKWNGVIERLHTDGEGLDEMVNILKGVPCKDHNHHHTADLEDDDEEDEIVVLEELDVGDDLGLEGAQNQGKKAEGAQNQGKKAEGAQNQGKKVEGAQNQGKKAEGAQNQGKKAESKSDPYEEDEEDDDDSGGTPNQSQKTKDAQNMASSGQQLLMSQVSLGSEVPPPDDKDAILGLASTPGGGGAGSMSTKMPAASQSAMLAQGPNVRDQSSAAASIFPLGRGSQYFPTLEVDVLTPPWKNGKIAFKSGGYALSSDYLDMLRDPNSLNARKYPLTTPQTFGKARPQPGLPSHQDKSSETSGLSDSSGPHELNEPFNVDFSGSPSYSFTGDAYSLQCSNPWSVTPSSPPPALAYFPPSDHLPPPQTIHDMLYWFVGFNQYGLIWKITEHVESLLKNFNKDVSNIPDAFDATGHLFTLDASLVTAKLTEACIYSAIVIYRITYRDQYTNDKDFKFESVYSQLYYSLDPACLLCQLRDYAYACNHQLQFLKSQCNRDSKHGGWKDCEYGSAIPSFDSPLQAFLTDAYDSKFKTHPFDPCDICLKSRVKMGFKASDFSKTAKNGSYLYYFLSPSCGGDGDPLLMLSSYLNCLTKRTPRTTGELCAFLFNFGKVLHSSSAELTNLGKALTKPHENCPGWDHFDDSELPAIRGIRDVDCANHNVDHAGSLSKLLGCDITNAQCAKLLSPTTHRAYDLYSPRFAHTYLSWTVYLTDRLWESLERLLYDLEGHVSDKCSSLHQCSAAMPLLYTHGFMPPEGKLQWPLTCSDIIVKLRTVVDGKPIATLMTCMDDFLYRVRMPFIYTLIALWSVAALLLSYTLLYRLDVLYLCSHFIRSKASHLIDVKALLTNSRKMLSLYDADYFDDDPTDLIDQLN